MRTKYTRYSEVYHNVTRTCPTADWGNEMDIKVIAKYLHQDVVLHIDDTLGVTPFDDSPCYNLEYEGLVQYSKSKRGGRAVYLVFQTGTHYSAVVTNQGGLGGEFDSSSDEESLM